jgi:hypothetical protein
MTVAQIAQAKMNETTLYEITSELMSAARKGGSHSHEERVDDITIYIFVDQAATTYAAFADDGDYIRTSNMQWFAGALAIALS